MEAARPPRVEQGLPNLNLSVSRHARGIVLVLHPPQHEHRLPSTGTPIDALPVQKGSPPRKHLPTGDG